MVQVLLWTTDDDDNVLQCLTVQEMPSSLIINLVAD
jgi:hypothetical protein